MKKITIIIIIIFIICILNLEIPFINTFTNVNNLTILNNKIDKIYYINLDRRPDRNEHFINLYNKMNIDHNKLIRYTAIDGLNYNFSSEEYKMFENADFLNDLGSIPKKIMGNQLSHYYILKNMIDNNYNNILIFQDDVIFRDDFVEQINKLSDNIPDDAEIINFGFHKVANLSYFEKLDINDPIESMIEYKVGVNDAVCVLNNNFNPCSLAYLVTLKGATNLVNYFNNYGFRRATDWNYQEYLVNKNINYGTKIALCTGNPSFESDIFNN